jgi:hypothetical protein
MYLTNLTPLHMPPLRRAERIEGERVRLAQEQHEVERERSARQEQREQQRAERRRAEAEGAAADLGRAMDIDRPRATASLISKAAAKGRGEVAELPPLTGLAKEIVRMGRVRRNEEPAADVLPSNPVALAIVLSGRKARGTIDASGERWLADFVGKFEAVRGLL